MLRQLIFVLLAGWLLAACGGNDAPGGIGPGPDAAVSGTVLDQRGLPVEGVVVSDGLLTTLTDEFGNYTLDSDLSKRRFVQVTIPAAYEIPVKDGIPQFWQRIPEGSAKVRADFTLTARRKAASRYTILMTADPQIRSRNARYDNFAFHSIDVYEEMCRDLQETAASITDRPVYSISLGDLVHNDMSLYPTYCAGIADFDFPVFNVIGNHDHVQNVATDREAVKKFEEYLGPTCYSVELGELHFIFLDNIIMKNNTLDPNTTGAYNDGLSDEVYSWLCNDLKYVDKNKIVMLCAHSSMFRKPDSEPAERDKHGPDYASRLAVPFRALLGGPFAYQFQLRLCGRGAGGEIPQCRVAHSGPFDRGAVAQRADFDRRNAAGLSGRGCRWGADQLVLQTLGAGARPSDPGLCSGRLVRRRIRLCQRLEPRRPVGRGPLYGQRQGQGRNEAGHRL